ncbi:hypothetical protein D0Z07_3337 [Hyphodiscus hymeniophilus]|uniref:NAD(P)-binding domain-containing protein n=1 Tax=Hyphodiscus hymeniophilus TaxID=353542 RepID=A0A9P6VKY1_9HELO|nr:hypothetical protein D0Z07_3337 [Hyphodiscus hymeniophilus]
MSLPTSISPTLALFGATGGCCRAVLHRSLQAGLSVNVLARTPSKLTTEFPSTEYPQLTIIGGNIRDAKAVERTLTFTEGTSTKLVEIIVSGVGMRSFGESERTVCEDGMNCILSSITETRAEGAEGDDPKIVVISTKGCSTERREVPVLMIPVYAVFVRIPIIDKRKMETAVRKSGLKWCILRPSHLTDGESKGLAKVRIGVEKSQKGGKSETQSEEIGYSIRREDVGLWIYQELVCGGGTEEWEGKIVGLTY